MTGFVDRRNERAADVLVHVFGVSAASIAVAFLLHVSIQTRDLLPIIAAVIYGVGLLAMFGFSAAYNLVDQANWKRKLRRLDHATIFLLIAGTYTPFALIGGGGDVADGLLAAIWLVALIGVALKLLRPSRFERVLVALYVLLGWAGFVGVVFAIPGLPVNTTSLLGIGGLIYTIGVAFHLRERMPYQIAIWHALVVLAAGFHYAAVLEAIALKG